MIIDQSEKLQLALILEEYLIPVNLNGFGMPKHRATHMSGFFIVFISIIIITDLLFL